MAGRGRAGARPGRSVELQDLERRCAKGKGSGRGSAGQAGIHVATLRFGSGEPRRVARPRRRAGIPAHRHARRAAEPRGEGHARLFWRDALEALGRFADGKTPSAEWGGTHPVTVRAHLPRSAADVWPLLSTAPGLMKWVANVEQFDPQQGGAFRFLSQYRGQDVVEQGVVQEIVPDSKLRLTWELVGEGWAQPTELLLSLEPDAGGTSILIAHTGFERLEAVSGAAARRNYAGAWPEVLADLKRLVAPVAAR